MSKLATKEELLKNIEDQFRKMQSEKLSMEDLENLVSCTRELHERALILRYKAFEEKVFGEAKEILDDVETANLDTIDEQKLLPQDESFEPEKEPEVVDIQVEGEPVFQVEGEPVFDFSLFDEPAKEEITEVVNTENLEEEIIAEESLEEKFVMETFDEESQKEDIEEISMEKSDEEAISEMEEESTEVFEDEPIEFTQEMHTFNETAHEENEEEAISSTHEEAHKYESDQDDLFKNILNAEDDSLSSRLMQSRLDTLIGAFGFNEKFQCIQDLFNGSADDFNQAIDVLDSLQTFEDAKKQLEFYYHLNKWDLESPITAEFVKKIERRFK